MTILGELVRRRRTPYLSPQSLRHYGYGWGGYDEDEPEEEEEEEEDEEREEEEEGPEEEEDDELGPYDQEGASKRNISGHKKASFRNCHLKQRRHSLQGPPLQALSVRGAAPSLSSPLKSSITGRAWWTEAAGAYREGRRTVRF